MPKPKPQSRRKKPPKRVLALHELEQAKAAVLNSLTAVLRKLSSPACDRPKVTFPQHDV